QFLSLSLFMPRILAKNPNDAFPPDNFTFGTYLLHRRPYLHIYPPHSDKCDTNSEASHDFLSCTSSFFFLLYLNLYVIRPFVRSYGESSTRTLSPGNILMK